MKFTAQEKETLLCALRGWQEKLESGKVVPHMDLDHDLLTTYQIDELCNRLLADYINVGENPTYPKKDWQYEVANGDTSLGYKVWVEHKVEADDGEG